jgi:hypothetical protein
MLRPNDLFLCQPLLLSSLGFAWVSRLPPLQRKKAPFPFLLTTTFPLRSFQQHTVMKFLSTLVLLAALSVFTEALHHDHVHRAPHNRILRRGNTNKNGRCRQRVRTSRCLLVSPRTYWRYSPRPARTILSVATVTPTTTPTTINSRIRKATTALFRARAPLLAQLRLPTQLRTQPPTPAVSFRFRVEIVGPTVLLVSHALFPPKKSCSTVHPSQNKSLRQLVPMAPLIG